MVDEAERPAITVLEVTNRNEFPIKEMFDGVPVHFPPGVAVEISAAMAAHFFGWPGDDDDRARHMAMRFGWGSRENLEWKKGTQTPLYYDNAMAIEIKPVYFDLVRRRPSDPIPADDGRDPDDLPPTKIEAGEDNTTKVGRRNRKAPAARRKRDQTERVR